MAHESGATPESFDHQLLTTHLFSDPAEAASFAAGSTLPATMDRVRKFSFEHGQLGQGAGSVDAIGIAFPSGLVLGDKANVKLRFSDVYMKQAVRK